MPLLTAPFHAGQPLVRVAIGVSGPRVNALHQAGQPVPDSQQCLALIDTGASHSGVDGTILQGLDLSPTGSANIVTASSGAGAHPCFEYDVSQTIFMDNEQLHLVSLTIPVMELQLLNSGFGVLIGRDVLAQGLLVYNGKDSEFLLSS